PGAEGPAKPGATAARRPGQAREGPAAQPASGAAEPDHRSGSAESAGPTEPTADGSAGSDHRPGTAAAAEPDSAAGSKHPDPTARPDADPATRSGAAKPGSGWQRDPQRAAAHDNSANRSRRQQRAAREQCQLCV